jgi:hypothetical protein
VSSLINRDAYLICFRGELAFLELLFVLCIRRMLMAMSGDLIDGEGSYGWEVECWGEGREFYKLEKFE